MSFPRSSRFVRRAACVANCAETRRRRPAEPPPVGGANAESLDWGIQEERRTTACDAGVLSDSAGSSDSRRRFVELRLQRANPLDERLERWRRDLAALDQARTSCGRARCRPGRAPASSAALRPSPSPSSPPAPPPPLPCPEIPSQLLLLVFVAAQLVEARAGLLVHRTPARVGSASSTGVSPSSNASRSSTSARDSSSFARSSSAGSGVEGAGAASAATNATSANAPTAPPSHANRRSTAGCYSAADSCSARNQGGAVQTEGGSGCSTITRSCSCSIPSCPRSARTRSSRAFASSSRTAAAPGSATIPWGRRKLAYEIDKKTDGIYHLLQFDAEPETLDELSRILKITDGVMRHLPTRRVKGATRPRPPGPEPVESAGREPEYAAANTRSQEERSHDAN